MARQGLLVVSNRLPIGINVQGGEIAVTRSIGGVATALSAVANRHKARWIGWTGHNDLLSDTELLAAMPKGLIPIQAETELFNRYYYRFANRLLWPAFHGFSPEFIPDEADWQAFVEMNRRFAQAIKAHVRPDDLIWIHDYHLALVPKFLREEGVTNHLGHFWHITIPPIGALAGVPHADEILYSLGQLDLLGLQTERDAANLLKLLLQAGRGQRPKQTRVLPIGIDFAAYRKAPGRASVQALVSKYRRQTKGKRVIFSLSRLDYTKGLLVQLRAIEQFFAACPEREQLVYKLVVAPSRERISDYQRLKTEVERMVKDINRRLGNARWQPIDHVYENLGFEEVVAWYQLADVLLLLPIIDGMNLIAKEYIASRQNEQGVLVLSTGAGAAFQLRDALLVPPDDPAAATVALERAITMPATEQAVRLSRLRATVRQQDVFWWAEQFVQTLTRSNSPFGE